MTSRLYFIPLVLFSCFLFLLAWAMYGNYSPVPKGDMWNGYLVFYNRLLDGDMSAWWAQHNEHRILLSRLLFWLDLVVFEGQSYFLIVVNFLLALSGSFLAAKIFQQAFRNERYSLTHWMLLSLIIVMPLSWVQNENMTWAFQSQFFLAQLIPLVAFYLFYLSEVKNNDKYFFASVFFGLASIGTMANGVLALPLLTIVAMVVSKNKKKVVPVYLFASFIALFLFFKDYIRNPRDEPILDVLVSNPLGMIQYVSLYIASPFHAVLEYFPFGEKLVFYCSMLIGMAAILACLSIFLGAIRWPRKFSFELVILGFISYIGATAFITAGGRLSLGLVQALSSRYTTPAILFWICFLIVFIRWFFIVKHRTESLMRLSLPSYLCFWLFKRMEFLLHRAH